MRFETKYNIGDKVWFRIEDIESYIKAHPYEELQQILESCFHPGYVYSIKVVADIPSNEPLISYVISNRRITENNATDYEELLQNCSGILSNLEQDVFSNFDEVTNMIKETHKNVLNGLKGLAESILKNYE